MRMRFIPGWLITLATFPGVIFHELGHQWFCHLTGVPVSAVCYFRLGNPAGYVIHEQPPKFIQSLLICLGPLISGTAIALLCFVFVECKAHFPPWVEYVSMWMGISIAANAFPSSGDAKTLWHATNRHIKHNLGALLGYPFVLFIHIANLLSFFWFDFIYAGLLWALVRAALGNSA